MAVVWALCQQYAPLGICVPFVLLNILFPLPLMAARQKSLRNGLETNDPRKCGTQIRMSMGASFYTHAQPPPPPHLLQMVRTTSLHVFHGLFSSLTEPQGLTAELNGRLISVSLHDQP